MGEVRNRILDFLTAPAKPPGDGCRSNPRRRSSARIEFSWHDRNVWRTIPARLQDISRAGASVLARSTPSLGQPARLRIIDGDGTPWVEAEIVGVQQETRTRQRIRLRFHVACPSYLLRLAILNAVETEDAPPVPAQGWLSSAPVGQG